jgi:arsenate reductase
VTPVCNHRELLLKALGTTFNPGDTVGMGHDPATDADMGALLGHVVDELLNQTAGAASREYLMELAEDVRAQTLAHAGEPFSPALAARFAHTRLRAELVRDGLITKTEPEVLVLSQDDTGLSQAVAALLRHYAPGRLHVVCAGLQPAGQAHESVRRILSEHGVVPTDVPTRCSTSMIGIADHLVAVGAIEPLTKVQDQDRHVWSDLPTTAAASDEDVTATLIALDRRVRRVLGDWLPGLRLPGPVFGPVPALV